MKTIVILSHVGFDNSPYCNYVHWHAKELAKQGYHVVVFAIVHWFPILSHFQKYKKEFIQRNKKEKFQMIDGVEVIYKKAISFSNFLYNSPINLNGIFYYKSIKKMFKKLYQKEEIELIDAHTFKIEGYVAYRLKKKYPNILTTVTLHGTSFDRNTKTKNGVKSIKKVFSKVDYAICVSPKIKHMLEKLNVNNAKVIFNGINQYDNEKVDKEKYKYHIISVGSLNYGKKHDVTIKVVGKLVEKYPDIQLDIIGEGKQKENLEQLVKRLNLDKKVTFRNRMSNEQVSNLMNQSYIFLLPSINEGFGITYVEAMNAGCIAIGTKNEGIDGFIKNKENGFLVNSNIEEIVNLIDEIYSNKYNIETIRNRACEDAKKLTWENNANEYKKLIEQFEEKK